MTPIKLRLGKLCIVFVSLTNINASPGCELHEIKVHKLEYAGVLHEREQNESDLYKFEKLANQKAISSN